MAKINDGGPGRGPVMNRAPVTASLVLAQVLPLALCLGGPVLASAALFFIIGG